ncbi:MAG: potassium channel protein [Lutibacter sp.]|uniref:potassium channel family protein n=1 Tax=Lutibacter sp. TaxID=1925666 RepID=UPI00181D71B0|nr:potassium channel protein [Lutibacter sp.]MBT8316606.1 potassium channel protein [Lutibacter sp.]NNJ57466.1 potassium channel protein [Lutibacter sp.]
MAVRTKLYISLILITIVLFIGVSGYTIISNESLIDSLYMTVITMSTVGFGTLHELNQTEKLFTIGLIVLSIGVYGYFVTALTEYLANDNFFQLLKYKKMQQKIQKLKNHTIVCGYGRNGRQAVVQLKKFNMPCIVIEKDKEILEELDKANMLYVEGDATEDKTLNEAAIKNAKSLITALPSDADNLFVVLSARQINKEFTIISRASSESSFKKLKIAGATNIIMPDKIGGEHMASLVVTPDLVEFVDKLKISEECDTNLEEIAINDLPKEFLNKTLLDLDLRRKTGCNVIGFKTSKNEYIINPEPTTSLDSGSNLIVLGRPNQIEKLRQML